MNWRLPTKKELNDMYKNLHKKRVGSFANDIYWSSSECGDHIAWSQAFMYGNQYLNYKRNYYLWVRAVRTFQSDKKYQIGDKTETGIIFYVDGNIYKECKFKDENVYNWNQAMKLFE